MKKYYVFALTFLATTTLAFTAISQPVASSYNSEPTPPAKPTSGYDNGFFIQSPDGDFKLGIQSRIDTMFYYDHDNVDDPTTTVNENYPATTFAIRRAKIALTPKLKNFSASVNIEYRTGTDTTWGAYGAYKFDNGLAIKFGMDPVQYDLISGFSSTKFVMNEAMIITTQVDTERAVWIDPATDTGWTTITRPSMGLPAQIGLFFSGSHINNKLNWEIAVGNGIEGTKTLNQNHKFQYSTRVSYVILGKGLDKDMTDYAYSETPVLAVGAGGAFESDPALAPATSPRAGQIMYNWSIDGTADVAFRWRGFSANIGGYYRQLKVGPAAIVEAGEKYLTDFGYAATLGMFIVPKRLELEAFGVQLFREGPDNNSYQYGGGLNYYFYGHNAKIQIDYNRFVDFDDIQGTNNRKHDRAEAKIQLLF